MICGKDDLGDCCGRCDMTIFNIIAVVPVLGRRQLVKHTIQRLLKKNGVSKVICVGDNPKDEKVCIESGAEWVSYPNKPLASKWNAGFKAAKKYSPDACLFVGSSDWISDNWITELIPYLKDYDMIGLPGCYLLDVNTAINKQRACYWPGYVGPREGESIGIGRLISARVLEHLSWMPFDDTLDHSLDYSMQQRVLKADGKLKLVTTDKIQSLAISCNHWPNKHHFETHWENKLPSVRIDPKENIYNWFPESLQLFK